MQAGTAAAKLWPSGPGNSSAGPYTSVKGMMNPAPPIFTAAQPDDQRSASARPGNGSPGHGDWPAVPP